MLAYTADPGRFGGDDEAIENVRVTDYETGALIDGQELSRFELIKPSRKRLLGRQDECAV